MKNKYWHKALMFFLCFSSLQDTFAQDLRKDSVGVVFHKSSLSINYACSHWNKFDSLVTILKRNPTWIISIDVRSFSYAATEEKKIQKMKKIIVDSLVSIGINQNRILYKCYDCNGYILTDKMMKAIRELDKTDECSYMEFRYFSSWRLISEDYSEIGK